MTLHPLESRLLKAFRLALAQRNLAVANHILAAIEALDQNGDGLDDAATAEAYFELARLVLPPTH